MKDKGIGCHTFFRGNTEFERLSLPVQVYAMAPPGICSASFKTLTQTNSN